MNKQNKVFNANWFDINYFRYMFKCLIKAKSIIIFSILYFFLIFCVTVIVPFAANSNFYELMLAPIIIIFMVFNIALIAICITINLYKNQIEDGSELLALSKCLTRKEIATSKIAIYLIFVLLINLIAGLLSLLSYITTNIYFFSNLLILLGFVVGGTIISFFFGGITLLFCCYCTKIKAFLLSLSLVLLMTLYSIVSMFASKGYSDKINNAYIPLQMNSTIDLKDDKAKNIINFYSIDTEKADKLELDYKNIDTRSFINQLYRSYQNAGIEVGNYLNLGSQFIQLMLMNQDTNELEKKSTLLEQFNFPSRLELSELNNMNEFYDHPFTISNLNFDTIEYVDNKLQFESHPINSIVPTYFYKSFLNQSFSINNKTFENEYLSTYYLYDLLNGNLNSNLWDTYWFETKQYVEDEFNKQLSSNIKEIKNKPHELFIAKIFKDIYSNNKEVDEQTLMDLLTQLTLNAFIKLRYSYNDINIFNLIDFFEYVNDDVVFKDLFDFNLEQNKSIIDAINNIFDNKYQFDQNSNLKNCFDLIKKEKDNNNPKFVYIYNYLKDSSKNSLELYALLGMVGVGFDCIISKSNEYIDTLDTYVNNKFTYNDIISTSMNLSDITNNPNDYYSLDYKLSLRSVQQTNLIQPVKVDIKYFFDIKALLIFWTLISFLMMVFANWKYFKKDFY